MMDPPGQRVEIGGEERNIFPMIYGALMGATIIGSFSLPPFAALIGASAGYMMHEVKNRGENAVEGVGGSYFRDTGTIGISMGDERESNAFRKVTSELLHAFQDDFDSPPPRPSDA